MVTLTAPYIIPLFLGMTYDAHHSRPGVDIYPASAVDDPLVTDFKQMSSVYKVCTTMEERKKALDIDGDLSLKIKGGLIDVAGKGSYLKNMRDYTNTVEILVTMDYKSSVHSFKPDVKPRDKWVETFSTDVLGTHYVSRIKYGLQMIGSLRLVVHNSSDVQNVTAEVNLALGSGSDSATEIAGKGKLEDMQKRTQDKSTMEISFYGTIPLPEKIPNTIEGFQDMILHLEDIIEKENLTDGIPLEVDLASLQEIADAEDRDKFEFLKNKVLQDKLTDLEDMLDELRQARFDLTDFAKKMPYNAKAEHEKQVGQLIGNITRVLQVFYKVIWDMDLTKGPEQLQPALDAYNYDGRPVYNRYNRMVTRLIKRLEPQMKRDDVAGATYIQMGSNNCTAAGTQILYKGFVTSSVEEGIGGVGQYHCAPAAPATGYDLNEKGDEKSHLAGIRWPKLSDGKPFQGKNAKKISEQGVSCALCHSEDSAAVVMFSATAKCPATWEIMYTGFLMSARGGGHTTEYVCVHDTPSEGHKMDKQSGSRDALTLTRVQSEGSLPSDTYPKDALIRCVVCSMKSNQITF